MSTHYIGNKGLAWWSRQIWRRIRHHCTQSSTTYLLIGKCSRAVNDGDVLVLVDRIGFLLDRRGFILHHLVLAPMRVYAGDEEATAIILDIVHIFSSLLFFCNGFSGFIRFLLIICIRWTLLILLSTRAAVHILVLFLPLQRLEVVDVDLELLLLLWQLSLSKHVHLWDIAASLARSVLVLCLRGLGGLCLLRGSRLGSILLIVAHIYLCWL